MKLFSRIFFTILSFVFFANNLLGQDTTALDSTGDNTTKIPLQKPAPALKTPRLSYSMELGAGFFSGSSLFSGTYTNIAPSINYLVSPKLNIEVGGVFTTGNTNFNQNSMLKSNPNLSPQTNQFFVFTNGQYALTNRLMLTGSFYSTLNSNKSQQINPYFLDYRGMDLGLNYKLTEHMSLGAQFRMSNGYSDNLFDQTGIGSFHHFGENKFGW
jgi:hypothetical protein